ncbi:hypothetical protein Bbelb_332250 [Branchiostoma belcheri]|nr:hypothetical protein Bbelb_332250 [Branchiostoma belcheri]
MEVRRSPRKKSPSPAPVYKIPSGSNSSDSSEEESQEKADKDFKPSHSYKPSHPEVRGSPRKKSPSPAPVYKIPSGSNSSDSSEEEGQDKSDEDFKLSHSFKPSHPEVRRSPRKKSPSPAPVYKIPSSSSSDSSEEEAQEKSDKDFKPSHSYKPNHPEPSSSCSSASGRATGSPRLGSGKSPALPTRQTMRRGSVTDATGQLRRGKSQDVPGGGDGSGGFPPEMAPEQLPPQSPSFQHQQSPLQHYMMAANSHPGAVQGMGPVSPLPQGQTTRPSPVGHMQVPMNTMGLPMTTLSMPMSRPTTSPSFQSPATSPLVTRRFDPAGSPGFLPASSPSPTGLPPQQQQPSPSMASPMHLQRGNPQMTTAQMMGPMGMPLSPTRGFPLEQGMQQGMHSPMRQLSVSPSGSGHFMFQEFRKTYSEQEMQRVAMGYPPQQQTGGTIHHHGQSPTRGNIPPLASPTGLGHGLPGMGMRQMGQVEQRRPSYSPTRASYDMNRTSPIASGYVMNPGVSQTSPIRTTTSPHTSPIPVKKQSLRRLEEKPPQTPEAAHYRKLLVEHHSKELNQIKELHNERLTELFFLQNGQIMMDYLAFKKRCTPSLLKFLKQHNLDDDEEEEPKEQRINDEQQQQQAQSHVELHAGMPVATNANNMEIEAFRRQQVQASAEPSRPPGGRHGMVFHPQNQALQQQLMSSMQGGLVTAQQQQQPTPFTTQQQPPPYPSPFGPAVPNTTPLHSPPPQPLPTHPPLQHQLSQPQPSTLPQAVPQTPPGMVQRTMSEPQQPTFQTPQQPKDLPKPLNVSTMTPASVTSTIVSKNTKSPLSPTSSQRLQTRHQHSISHVYDTTIGSQEEIVERAKQEAAVQQRVAELRKEGLWSQRRLPKVQEPPRPKAHWDYLLEEMQWLATDFAQERKWKMAAAKKLARAVVRFHQERKAKEVRAEKEEALRLRRIASNMAKEIKAFWANIEKVVQYKQHSRLEEQRKKALDLQLNFIVDQTEKYSSWLTQGLKEDSSLQGSAASSPGRDTALGEGARVLFVVRVRSLLTQGLKEDSSLQGSAASSPGRDTALGEGARVLCVVCVRSWLTQGLKEDSSLQGSAASSPGRDTALGEGESWLTQGLKEDSSLQGSAASSPGRDTALGEDDEFEPDDESDDEETLDQEEEADDQEDVDEEVALLQQESEVPLEDLISKLPPEILEKPAEAMEVDGNSSSEEEEEDSTRETADDDEFMPSEASEEEGAVDDEETIEEQEEAEGEADHAEELDDLQKEGEMSMEELIKKYGGAYEEGFEPPPSPPESSLADEEYEDEETDESETEEPSDDEEEEMADIGMEYLIHGDKENHQPQEGSSTQQEGKGPSKEITDIAADAAACQPTGYTLSTTQVKTPVPFLLKHTLREYQHIGLDWLVTMYDKKLNGILADEMGLGKTIQTIALFGHLACDKGIWGPHLIVVPTSVMLNWEMEFKKWCPAFKILTYYGNQKERKQKRQGWTKPNSFHVCITSYKLVIQDHQSFRRKKWKYLVLDEAQNIKNFKSQRWQTLLNFQSQRRLLLTGTPLQNNLMELWSLMHFLMPHVFQSHREFREWFSNPVTGMIEGNTEYNEGLIRRLHKVLRPFLLRRLKQDVEKQLPNKYEHVVTCRLSKRQRFLYDDFMSQAKTRETLASGHFMSVINILMQLRKVCNHPDLFDPRPIISPFNTEGICYYTASLVHRVMEYHPLQHVNLGYLNLCLSDLELSLPAYAAHRVNQLQASRQLIEEIDSQPDPPPRLPPMKLRPSLFQPPAPKAESGRSSPLAPAAAQSSPRASPVVFSVAVMPPRVKSPAVAAAASPARASPPVQVVQAAQQVAVGTAVPAVTTTAAPVQPKVAASLTPATAVTIQGVAQMVTSTTPAAVITTQPQQLPGFTIPTSLLQQRLILQGTQRLPTGEVVSIAQLTPATTTVGGVRQPLVPSQPITVQIHQTQQGARLTVPTGQIRQLPGGFVQIIQTTTGHQILRTASPNIVTAVPQSQAQLLSRTSSPATQGTGLVTQTVTVQRVPTPHTQIAQQPQALIVQQAQQQQPQKSISHSPVQVITLTTAHPRQAQTPPQQVSKPAVTVQLPKTVTVTSTAKPIVKMAPLTSTGNIVLVSGASVSGTSGVSTAGLTTTPKVIRYLTVSGAPAGAVPAPVATPTTASVARTTVTTVSATTATVTTTVSTAPTVSTSVVKTTATSSVQKKPAEKSPFHLEYLEKQEEKEHKETLLRIAEANRFRCSAKPVYGSDLVSKVSDIFDLRSSKYSSNTWRSVGLVNCHNMYSTRNYSHPAVYWSSTDALRTLLPTPEQRLEELGELIDRYVFEVPRVSAPPITMHTSHPPPSLVQRRQVLDLALRQEVVPRLRCYHRVERGMLTQFPDPRLVQYDCGKLQRLDKLLRQLKQGQHRVLIFTQMTRMLDVLERFLNYHGHIYLRLDGTTRIEQRQALMERFNADYRIFVFILSTRSGGIGVNLTGADTVIFYDSDWNPTMDAQAQDRCHRIGQTRDVNIYRLVSERTVEENILKKANQKRLLVDVSIEGGNFTTAFFKETSLKELFDMNPEEERAQLQARRLQDTSPSPVPPKDPKMSQAMLEQALAKAEDDTDVQAAKLASAEAAAELAEFNETIPLDEDGENSRPSQQEEVSKVEEELAQLDDQLSPIEKYAVMFLERSLAPFSTEQLKVAAEQVEAAKKDWELGHDAKNQVHKSSKKRKLASARDSPDSRGSGSSLKKKLRPNAAGKSVKNNTVHKSSTRDHRVKNAAATAVAKTTTTSPPNQEKPKLPPLAVDSVRNKKTSPTAKVRTSPRADVAIVTRSRASSRSGSRSSSRSTSPVKSPTRRSSRLSGSFSSSSLQLELHGNS